ncbi:MAG TPA: hypothetical protein VFL91_26180 [Thermomicrobiales bacterium]|nr:hypothetical protein [Thermomicrobiales bacterium]
MERDRAAGEATPARADATPLRQLAPDDPAAPAAIAALLGATAGEAPFRYRGTPVHRLTLERAVGGPLRLDLWPALRRVDVAWGDSFAVFTGIEAVQFVPGVEVIFRRATPPGFLTVTVAGAVLIKA